MTSIETASTTLSFEQVYSELKSIAQVYPNNINPEDPERVGTCLYWGEGSGCIVGQWLHEQHGVEIDALISTPGVSASTALELFGFKADHVTCDFLDIVQVEADRLCTDAVGGWDQLDLDYIAEATKLFWAEKS